jgi:hypothetical protein
MQSVLHFALCAHQSAFFVLHFDIIRASFSQERMTYLSEESKVIYESKDGKEEKVFDALQWLAAMDSRVPGQGRTDGKVDFDL